MVEFELLLKFIIPFSCFIINIFCIAYSLGINSWGERNKAYVYYLIAVNCWIILDPLIFNFDIGFEYIKLITKIRPILWLPIGLLFLNLVYKLTNKSVDIFINFFGLS